VEYMSFLGVGWFQHFIIHGIVAQNSILVHTRYAFSLYLNDLLNAGDLTSPVMMRRCMQSSDVSLDRAWYIDRP
jgi:hypothetical protein